MVSIASVTMTLEEYNTLVNQLANNRNIDTATAQMELSAQNIVAKPKRKQSAYNRKYKAAFKKLAPKYKLKSGKWKKNGFKAAVRAAHKAVKK